MKHFFLVILLLSLPLLASAQDKETMAKAHYMAAESSFNEGKFSETVQDLKEAEQALGSSNPKIKYLMVKSYVELQKYDDAKKELSLYFDLAANNKGSDKYEEMTLLLGQIDKKAREASFEKQIDKYVAELEQLYKQCYFFMQNDRKQEQSKVESVIFKEGQITCNYSGKITGGTPSYSYPVVYIGEVVLIPNMGKRSLYDVAIKYRGSQTPVRVFFAINTEECAKKMAAVLTKLGSALDQIVK